MIQNAAYQSDQGGRDRDERDGRSLAQTCWAIANHDVAGSTSGQRHTLQSPVDLQNMVLGASINTIKPSMIVGPAENQVATPIMLNHGRPAIPVLQVDRASWFAKVDIQGSRSLVFGQEIRARAT